MFNHKEHEGCSRRTQRLLKYVSRKERGENAKAAKKINKIWRELVFWWQKIRCKKATIFIHEEHYH